VHVGAALDQEFAELVVAVLRRGEQRAPAVTRDLIHVRAGLEQRSRRFEVTRAGRVDERRQLAAVGLALLLAPEAAAPAPGTRPGRVVRDGHEAERAALHAAADIERCELVDPLAERDPYALVALSDEIAQRFDVRIRVLAQDRQNLAPDRIPR